MNFKSLIFIFLILLMGFSWVNAHGVDVTDNHMVIADESNGVNAKILADDNNINITVYKFTSNAEVEHILLHAVNNTNKKIVVIAYQDEVKEFLKEYPELSDRIFISSDDDNDLLNAMLLASEDTYDKNNLNNIFNFLLPLVTGLIVGILIGLAGGLFLAKLKLS